MSKIETKATLPQVFNDKKSQQDLLEDIALGNQGSFGELYDQLSSRVFGLILKVLRDRAQSEEVTQEVFIEVWQNASNYNPQKGSASTWIMTISHRKAVDRVRSSQASHDRDTKIGIRDYVADYNNVEETVQVNLENERVNEALKRLTEFQRQAVTLSYYKGYSHKEVAETLKVPVGTVKTRLRDGMIRLRDELGVTS